MSAHSKIGASSYHRWKMCPGSVALCEPLPEVSSPYAEEGTKAHELGEKWLRVHACPVGETPSAKAEWEKFKSTCEPDMLSNVKTYVDYVLACKKEQPADPKDLFLVEQRLNLESIHPGLFGTGDVILYHAQAKLLRVIDLKYGAGVAVDIVDEEEPNEQLMYYALGALLQTKVPASEVEITIVQPRCPHADGVIRSHRFNALDLIEFGADLAADAKRTEDPKAPLVPGDHCKFCKAKGICPALHEKALAVASNEFSPAFSYDPVKLSETLTMLPAVEAWVKGVREFAYREAMHGRCPTGFKLVEKRATRKWAKPEEEVAISLVARCRLTNAQVYETSLKSPAQIEKELPKNVPNAKEEFNKMVVSISSGLTLAPESDKRPPAKVDPASEFDEITGGCPGPSIFE